MADDRLLLTCSVCGKDQPIACLFGYQYRAFRDVEALQDFIEKHLGCSDPHVQGFEGDPFVIKKEHE